jgi:anthranilate/para-aminobenzoate synthase component I
VRGVVREIAAPADIEALARALGGAPGVAVLRSDGRGALREHDAATSFVACDPVERWSGGDAWVPAQAREPTRAWNGRAAAPRWIGLVPYEATRAIERKAWTRSPDVRPPALFARPTWMRYDAVARVDHATGTVCVEADDAPAADRLADRLATGLLARRAPTPIVARLLPPHEPDDAHAARIRAVLERIAAGDVYQVNVARAIDLEIRAGDPLDVFARLYRASPAPYGFFADFGDACVCAASPELALEVRGDRLRTTPIKGTRPRGDEARADLALARALDADAKERAELTMAIDLHRNDLGRVAAIGSVRVLGDPRVLGGVTVWSRVAEVVARRAEGATLEQIARAVLPCGSVTGAPKVRAMEIIAELEPVRRGAYTGAFGYVSRAGDLVLAMAIRTLEVAAPYAGHPASARSARYATGGGIVADSDPLREVEETKWKAAQLASLLSPSSAEVVRSPTVSLAEEGVR